MKRTTVLLSLGFAVLAAGSAQAGDWNNGAGVLVKDSGGMAGVPVPAPAPVAESFKWYLRADFGLGVLTGGKASETGMLYAPDRDPSNGSPFGSGSGWYKGLFNNFSSGGVGAGLYLSPRWRTDLTFDVRSKSNVLGTADYN